MKNGIELLDAYNSNSIIRNLFNKEINLMDFPVETAKIPASFKDYSFIPKEQLDLIKISKNLEESLKNSRINDEETSKTISGICEAIKNAYEHGNLKDNSKKIYLAKKFSKGKLEFFVGDEGWTINGNLFPYILLFREKNNKESLDEIPDFYSFCGQNYAPIGHSGVGTKVMNKCFEDIKYFKGEKGLLVYMEKQISRNLKL